MVFLVLLEIRVGVAVLSDLFFLKGIGVMRRRPDCLGVAFHADSDPDIVLAKVGIDYTRRKPQVRKITFAALPHKNKNVIRTIDQFMHFFLMLP